MSLSQPIQQLLFLQAILLFRDQPLVKATRARQAVPPRISSREPWVFPPGTAAPPSLRPESSITSFHRIGAKQPPMDGLLTKAWCFRVPVHRMFPACANSGSIQICLRRWMAWSRLFGSWATVHHPLASQTRLLCSAPAPGPHPLARVVARRRPLAPSACRACRTEDPRARTSSSRNNGPAGARTTARAKGCVDAAHHQTS